MPGRLLSRGCLSYFDTGKSEWADYAVQAERRNPTWRNAEYKLYVEYGRKFTFSNRIAPAWKALSLITKSTPNVNKFKNLLDRDPNFLVNKFDYGS